MSRKIGIGDLVKWTYPGHEGLGIVLPHAEAFKECSLNDTHVSIHWFDLPKFNGLYNANHEHLKLVKKAT